MRREHTKPPPVSRKPRRHLLLAIPITLAGLAVIAVLCWPTLSQVYRDYRDASYWMASYGCAKREEALKTTLTEVFATHQRVAQQAARERRLPAFDRPGDPNQSRPVLDTNGDRTAHPLASCTSLLGDLEGWALEQEKRSKLLTGPGSKVSVVELRESFREVRPDDSGRTVYALRYTVEAAAGVTTQVRADGDILLLSFETTL